MWPRVLRRRKSALVGLLILTAVALAALFAPALAPYDPIKVRPAEALSPPSLTHPFGTDQYGRDILSRAMTGARLSLQMHHHRAEHWVVVRGTAEVTCGAKTFLLSENQSTFIPLGEVHRLRNPGKTALEMIEIQSGSYLHEDDIVRIEDVYGRVGTASSGVTK